MMEAFWEWAWLSCLECFSVVSSELDSSHRGYRERGKGREQERHAVWAWEGSCCVISWLWRAINLRGGQGIPSCPLMALNRFSWQLTSGHLPLLDACLGFCPCPDIPPTHGKPYQLFMTHAKYPCSHTCCRLHLWTEAFFPFIFLGSVVCPLPSVFLSFYWEHR